jgi:hypothetical protein
VRLRGLFLGAQNVQRAQDVEDEENDHDGTGHPKDAKVLPHEELCCSQVHGDEFLLDRLPIIDKVP